MGMVRNCIGRNGSNQWSTYILDLCASKSGEGVGAVRGSDQPGLAKVVLCLQISDLGFVGPVDNAHGDREDGVALGVAVSGGRFWKYHSSAYLCFLPNRLVNDIVILDDLFLDGILQILQTSIFLLKIDVAESPVEEHFARV